MTKLQISKTKKIILSGLLVAIFILLDRVFTVNTQIIKVNLSIIAVAIAAVLFGPAYAILVGALGDLIGSLTMPFGPYFPGFTLSAALYGLIYGLALYKDPNKQRSNINFIIRLIISSIVITGLVNILLNALWLNILYGKAYIVLITTRITTQLILLPIHMITIFSLVKALEPVIKKHLYEKEDMEVEEYLNQFMQATKDPTLEGMYFLMEKFNNPHKKVKLIHVAGTNGKGSICEMLNNILIKSGYKVGKYMTPYLIRFNEEIMVNGKEIDDQEIKDILTEMDVYIKEYNKTHTIKIKRFEVVTSLAFIYFAKRECDFAVIETGLGGTWDCTNIIEPEVSIISKIGYDHMDFLGDTIKEIAGHKAGIIKKNSNTVFFDEKGITEIIEKVCKEKDNKLHLIREKDITNYKYEDNFEQFDYKDYKYIKVNLRGRVQTINAAQCIEAVNILKEKGYQISDEAVKKGLATVTHKARLEVLNENPLIIFDGGHNESAIINLLENINSYYKNYKRTYIVSILKSKDYKTIIKNLCQDDNAVFIFTNGIDRERYVNNKKLYDEAKNYITKDKISVGELEEAIKKAKEESSDKATFVVGSFYVYSKVCELIK